MQQQGEEQAAEGLKKVRVVVRVRPFVSKEVQKRCVEVRQDLRCVELRQGKSADSLRYAFDGAYDCNAGQEELFRNEIEPFIDTVFCGLNTTIFAYGMTGAGKTFTMQGTVEERGIIPRVAEKVIGLAQQRAAASSLDKYSITVSYLEIYNEKVYDLLRTTPQDLPIREDSHKNIFIPDLTEVRVSTLQQFEETYLEGCRNRTTAATSLNANSSRSHAVLILKVKHKQLQSQLQSRCTFVGKLHLIDLAGSEDNRRTDNTGLRLTESSNINRSLFVLGKVVNALNDGLRRIPYRDSKLTRLLQDSLGGRSHGVMIANISPAQTHFHDTMNTLNFASKSRMIVNKPVAHSVADITRNTTEGDRRLQLAEWRNSKKGNNSKFGRNQDPNKENVENGRRRVRRQGSNGLDDDPERMLLDMKTALRLAKTLEQKMLARIENVDAKVEAMRQRSTHGELMSPFLRQKKLFDESTQTKLELLERNMLKNVNVTAAQLLSTISEQSEQHNFEQIQPAKQQAAIATPSSDIQSSQVDTAVIGLLTPLSRLETAKEMISRAKLLERMGRINEAISFYKKAQPLLPPTNSKLILEKVAKLEKMLSSHPSSRENISSPYEDEHDDQGPIHPAKLRFEDSSSVKEDENHNETLPQLRKARRTRLSPPTTEAHQPEPVVSRKLGEKTSSPETDQILHILNHGTLKELLQLHCIGKKRAQMIIEYRTERPFLSLSDLSDIGFGDKLFCSFLQRNVGCLSASTTSDN
ncbi:GDP-fucose protein O-fucosyltransferase 1 [Balamuthia mandrillaris]